MEGEKNQNTDLLQQFSSQERVEKQQELQNRVKALQEQEKITRQEVQNLKAELTPALALHQLESRVNALDLKNQDRFTAEVQKIEEELKVLENARYSLRDLKSGIQVRNPQLYAQLQKQFPHRSQSALLGIVESVLNIRNIADTAFSQPDPHPIARRAQKMFAKILS